MLAVYRVICQGKLCNARAGDSLVSQPLLYESLRKILGVLTRIHHNVYRRFAPMNNSFVKDHSLSD